MLAFKMTLQGRSMLLR